MSDLTVAVVDDDPEVGRTIQDWLSTERPDITVRVFRSGEEFLLSPELYSIVYVDVVLDGSSGLETARRLRDRQPDVLFVFISGMRDYVFEALDLHPFHYLLKPLDRAGFVRVFEEACDTVKARESKDNQRLVIRTRQGSISLPAADIMYVERGPRRLLVHTKDGTYEMYGSLSRLEGELGDNFFRCHRAFLVNLAWIRSYRSDSIVLNNGETVFLARKKYSTFVKQYMWYLGGNRLYG